MPFEQLKSMKVTPEKNRSSQIQREPKDTLKLQIDTHCEINNLEDIKVDILPPKTIKNSISNFVLKYKPTANCLYTPVRSSTRNSSINRNIRSNRDHSQKAIKLEVSPISHNLAKELVKSKKTKAIQKSMRNCLSQKKEQKQDILKTNKLTISKNRIEMIHNKNAKQQALYHTQEASKEKQDLEPLYELIEKVVDSKPQRMRSSPSRQVKINNYNIQNIVRKYQKEPDILVSINELTGEDTASVKSSVRLDSSIIMNLCDQEQIIKGECDLKSTIMEIEKVDSIEYGSLKSPDSKKCNRHIQKLYEHRYEVEDLDDFVKNILSSNGKERDIQVKNDKIELDHLKENYDNILDLEYYDTNKSNNSLRSHSHREKLIKHVDNTLELVSKRSGTEQSNGCGTNNILHKRKESYSNAFLELLNSELKSDSPKNSDVNNEYRREINVSGINFDISNCSESNSDEMSWNIISDKNTKCRNKKQDFSNEKCKILQKCVNNYDKINLHIRKRSLNDKNKINLISQVIKKNQQSDGGMNDEDLFKISCDKTSENSLLFELSHSKVKDQKSNFAKQSKDESSDMCKDESSTLKDFSNLCSSKGSSMIDSFKFGMISRNNIKTEGEKHIFPKQCNSSNILISNLQKNLEITENHIKNCSNLLNCSDKVVSPTLHSFETKRMELNEAKSTNSNSLL